MGQLARLAGAYKGADQFLELRFPRNTMQLNALSSLGAIDFRLLRPDNGLLDQNNDYSFQANYGNVALNNRIIVFLTTRSFLVHSLWSQPPG